jgi:hypothetical protein
MSRVTSERSLTMRIMLLVDSIRRPWAEASRKTPAVSAVPYPAVGSPVNIGEQRLLRIPVAVLGQHSLTR